MALSTHLLLSLLVQGWPWLGWAALPWGFAARVVRGQRGLRSSGGSVGLHVQDAFIACVWQLSWAPRAAEAGWPSHRAGPSSAAWRSQSSGVLP